MMVAKIEFPKRVYDFPNNWSETLERSQRIDGFLDAQSSPLFWQLETYTGETHHVVKMSVDKRDPYVLNLTLPGVVDWIDLRKVRSIVQDTQALKDWRNASDQEAFIKEWGAKSPDRWRVHL
jgi:hypothetical protein